MKPALHMGISSHRKACSLFRVRGVQFDGASSALSSTGLSGVSDSQKFTLSLWFKPDAQSSAALLAFAASSVWKAGVLTSVSAGGTWALFRNAAGTNGINYVFGWPAQSLWHHVLISADTSMPVGMLYVDDVPTVLTVTSGINFNFSAGTVLVGARSGGYFPGSLAEVWLMPGTYMDLTVAANRRKFRTADGRPVDLGSTGSTPTGSQPPLYLSVRASGSANDFATNRGSGGDFSVLGSPSLSTSSPSY